MIIRDFAALFTVWFSIPNRMGLGAVPIGVLLLPFFLRLRAIEWLLFASCTLVIFSNVKSITDLWAAMQLMIGITIFFSFLTESTTINRKVFWIVVCPLVLEALFGWAANVGSFRSNSLITQEPSHAARIIFVVMIALVRRYEMTPKKISLLAMLGAFYVGMNKSSSAFLMYIIFLIVAFSSVQVARKLYLVPLLMGLAFVFVLFTSSPDSRFITHTKSVANAVTSGLTYAQIMNLGSRRLSQSIGGFAAADLWGHGYSTDGMTFLEHSYQAGIDLYMPSIIDKNVQGPSSYFGELVYRAGWLRAGCLLMLILLAIFTRIKDGLSWTLLLTSFGQLLFFSTTTIPTPWILLALTPDKASR